jgi:hypothetical protein
LAAHTWDEYDSASVAEAALRIGKLHPGGPFSSPTDRVDLDLRGISYHHLGIVPGGTGTELTTGQSPLVTNVTGLKP